MDFIYFLMFWGIFLSVCGLVLLLSPNHSVLNEDTK